MFQGSKGPRLLFGLRLVKKSSSPIESNGSTKIPEPWKFFVAISKIWNKLWCIWQSIKHNCNLKKKVGLLIYFKKCHRLCLLLRSRHVSWLHLFAQHLQVCANINSFSHSIALNSNHLEQVLNYLLELIF